MNAALPPAAPLVLAGAILGRATPIALADLQALYDQLLLARTAVTVALVDLSFARSDLADLRARLRERMADFIDFVRGNLPASKYERALPFQPGATEGLNRTQDAGGRLGCLWRVLDASTGLGLTLPVTLRDGYGVAAFRAAVDALAPGYLAISERACEAKLARETRNDLQEQIALVLKAYRQVMPMRFAPGSALTASLPAYSPGPGRSPRAVKLDGTWDAAAGAARFAFSPSTDPALEKYELRAVPGEEYEADDESVVASLPGDAAAREFVTAEFLAVAGQVASFKVYVLLASGHESGSGAVTIRRPVETG